jgi:hypothetical protein
LGAPADFGARVELDASIWDVFFLPRLAPVTKMRPRCAYSLSTVLIGVVMLRTVIFAATLFRLASPAGAVSTGFEDLSQGSHPIDSSFTSGGIGFNVVAFPNSFGEIVAASGGGQNSSGGSGQLLHFSNSAAIAIQLSDIAELVSFRFGDFGNAATWLVINGVASPTGVGFGPANGQAISVNTPRR